MAKKENQAGAGGIASTRSATTSQEKQQQHQTVVQAQLQSLQDADPYATAWAAALEHAWSSGTNNKNKNNSVLVRWGGRGQGGRGRARRTWQPHTIVVEPLSMTYIHADNSRGGSPRTSTSTGTALYKPLLEDTILKIHTTPSSSSTGNHRRRRVYALLGKNGVGKSSLLQHLHGKTLTGLSPQVTTHLVSAQQQDQPTATSTTMTVRDYMAQAYLNAQRQSAKAQQFAVQELEAAMDALDLETSEGQEEMERLNEQLAEAAEDEEAEADLDTDDGDDESKKKTLLHLDKDIHYALAFMGLLGKDDEHEENHHVTYQSFAAKRWPHDLSPGQQQKVRLATAVLLCREVQLLLLDEPTWQLDIDGLLRLRRLLALDDDEEEGGSSTTSSSSTATVILVSHDVDLLNDVTTDVIDWRKQRLHYYTNCNYAGFLFQRQKEMTQHVRQMATVTRKKQAAVESLQHVKEQNPGKRKGAAKKKAKKLSAQRQKISRIAADEQAAQAALLDHTNEDDYYFDARRPCNQQYTDSKAIQFVLRNPASQWYEPLILAYSLGHGYGKEIVDYKNMTSSSGQDEANSPFVVEEDGQVIIRKKPGFLFDYVDLCIDEGGTYAILGPSASGKSTLLRLLAGLEMPVEGQVKHALNANVAYVNEEGNDDSLPGEEDDTITTLAYLQDRFPQKTEQEIRGEMTNFGLGPRLALTSLRFLSGGERARLRLAALFLSSSNDTNNNGVPDVLLWEDPTAHLDPASVEALIKGLREWKGTLVLVSHDTHLLAALEAQCWALIPQEGKLRRVEGGVEEYLQSFCRP